MEAETTLGFDSCATRSAHAVSRSRDVSSPNMATRSQLNFRFLVYYLLLVVAVVEASDLYKVLGVDKNASERDIKKAFHKQSLKYHPDKNKAKNAQSKFEEVSHAYEVLSDAEKRKHYDLTGDEKGQGFGGSPGGYGSGNFGGPYAGHQSQSGGPFFQSGGPGRTFTFTFGGPDQQAGEGGQQGFSQFFGNSQSQRQSRRRPNSQRNSGEETGWARNMYNKFAGNDEENPGSGFGNFGGFGGGVFDNLFSSFTDGSGDSRQGGSREPKSQSHNGKDTVNLARGIEQLNPTKFKSQVLGTSTLSWAVLYFVPNYPGINDRLKILASFGEELKGILKVGAIDCDSHAKFCKEQEVQLFPKLLIYPLRAEGRTKPVPYLGDWTTKALLKFYNQQFSLLVTSLTHQNFVEAMSKTQERPWAILVRKTKDIPVAWLAACGEFETRIDCYEIRVNNEEDPIAKKLGASVFPTVVGLLTPGEQLHLENIMFDKSLVKSVGALRTFLKKLEKKESDLERIQNDSEPVTFLTQKNMKKKCGPDSSLCIIATSKSSEGEAKAKQILHEISQKSLVRKAHGSQPVSYSLVDGAKRATFLKAFSAIDLSSIDTVVVAYKPRKGRSAVYKGPLTLEGVEDFVTRVLVGDLAFEPVYQAPVL